MGYTHYWRNGANASAENEAYGRALEVAGQIVRSSRDILAGADGTGRPEIGDGLVFNGIGDESHETFYLPANAQELTDFDFCKTACKPYDVVAVAVLCTIAHVAPGCLAVSSDGQPEDWTEGLALARKVTGLPIGLPPGIEC
jgi:hypothetical protein